MVGVAQADTKVCGSGQFRSFLSALSICVTALCRRQLTHPKPAFPGYGFTPRVGTQSRDINDPTRKYQLKSLSGKFSGLSLSAIMYAAFRQMEPSLNMGIDDGKECGAATTLRGSGGHQA